MTIVEHVNNTVLPHTSVHRHLQHLSFDKPNHHVPNVCDIDTR
jgi:hypothetical protein